MICLEVPMEVEEAATASSPTMLIPSIPKPKPPFGLPSSPQSPRRAPTPPGMNYIPLGPIDEAAGHEQRIEEYPPAALRDAIDANVSDLVQFLIYKYRMKEQTSRREILYQVVRHLQRFFNLIIAEAIQGLRLIFGIDIKEVDLHSHSYILSTALGITYDGLEDGLLGMPKTGLLIIVLGIISLKGNSITEDAMWRALITMGIDFRENHYIAGDVKNLLTEDFVQEGYLRYRHKRNTAESCYEFLWGSRAYSETTKKKVLEFLAEIAGVEL